MAQDAPSDFRFLYRTEQGRIDRARWISGAAPVAALVVIGTLALWLALPYANRPLSERAFYDPATFVANFYILAFAGALTIGYGGLLVLEQVLHDNPGPVGFLTWWAGGPLVVDLLAVPVVVVTAIGLDRVLPAAWRRAVEAAALVNLLLVLVAAPFLTGLGRRPDNPSLLDRNYVLGFGVLVGLVWLVALLPPAIRTLRARR